MRFMESVIVAATMNSVMISSGTLSITIETTMLTIMMTLEISCGMDWEIIWRMVSISLVYTLMISPWACVSKYLIGRRSILEKSLTRRFFSVPCETKIIR